MDIITFSPAALKQIKKNVQESEHSGLALRIAAQMTANENVQYGIGFDEAKEEDTLFENDGFKIIISPDCLELLHGTHIDFVEIENEQHHFIFLNPNDPSYKAPADDAVTK